MQNQESGDRLIAKLQYFADSMNQRKLEKEALSIVVHEKSLRSEIRSEILIYDQIIDEYHDIFKDILYR